LAIIQQRTLPTFLTQGKVENFRIPPIFLQHMKTYYLNIATSNFFPHKCGDLGPFIYLFFKKGSSCHLHLHQGLVARMQKFAPKIKSRTYNFCIQCLSCKKVSPVHRHQIPIGSQQHKRMLDFIFYFHMLFSQIWLNHLWMINHHWVLFTVYNFTSIWDQRVH
jgi:hypothetical protein